MQLSPRTSNYILEGERERLLQDALHKIMTRNYPLVYYQAKSDDL